MTADATNAARSAPFGSAAGAGRARAVARPALTLIAAVDRNRAIGHRGALLWREPQDQQRFRELTMGHPVVMGRKTFDSLPSRFRPLPGRRNIVVTRNRDWRAEGAEAAFSLADALALAAGSSKVFVIGGGELYAQALPLADEIVLTEIDAEFAADTFFPPFAGDFSEVARESRRAADGTRFHFVTYRRKR